MYRLRLAQSLYNDQKYDDAITEYKVAVELFPAVLKIKIWLAQTYEKNDQRDEAIATYQDLIAKQSDYFEAYLNLASLYHEAKMFTDLQEFINNSLPQVKTDKQRDMLLLLLGTSYFEQQQYTTAQQTFKQVSDTVTSLSYIGALHEELGEYDSARSAYLKVIEQNPGNYRTLYSLADVYTKLEQPENANATYEAIIVTIDTLLEKQQDMANLYFFQANAYQQLEQFQEAAEAYHNAIKSDPSLAAAYNNLGYMWADQEIHLEEARELIQKALELEPGSSAYLDSLGLVLMKLEKFDEAITALEQAFELSKDDPEIYLHLGDAYQSKKKSRKAQRVWQQGLEKFPDDALLKERLEKHQE